MQRARPLGWAFAPAAENGENAVFRGSGRGHAALSMVSGLLAGSATNWPSSSRRPTRESPRRTLIGMIARPAADV